ncbi:MAG: deoxyribonuclease IV [Planctomycetota bacterium]|nr:deoxyribonuclease IV [Planctomycetota bacterium]
MMIGSHLSIAGGLHKALLSARELEMPCVQVFTANPRSWSKSFAGDAPSKAGQSTLTDETVRLWRDHLRDTGLSSTVSHDSYLINLGAPDPASREKSAQMFRGELERCEALGIPLAVTHPGASLAGTVDEGLAHVAESLDAIHAMTPGFKVVTCLEIVAGQGTTLGRTFEELKAIIDRVKAPERVAVCLDTAHMLEGGYDLTSAKGAKAVFEECDAVLGISRVRVMHINDSKTPRGSRVDRHEHIGQGHVALAAFEVVMNHPALAEVPKILETPKEGEHEGRPWDAVNRDLLAGMVKKAPKNCK